MELGEPFGFQREGLGLPYIGLAVLPHLLDPSRLGTGLQLRRKCAWFVLEHLFVPASWRYSFALQSYSAARAKCSSGVCGAFISDVVTWFAASCPAPRAAMAAVVSPARRKCAVCSGSFLASCVASLRPVADGGSRRGGSVLARRRSPLWFAKMRWGSFRREKRKLVRASQAPGRGRVGARLRRARLGRRSPNEACAACGRSLRRRLSGGATFVAVMQATYLGNGHDLLCAG